MSKLLSAFDSNPKTAKNTKIGWGTAVLHLAPAGMSGFQVCQGRSAGCEAACLHFAGSPVYAAGKDRARIAKTKMFFENRASFMRQLVKELEAHIRKCKKLGLKPAARLNATSDLPWERIRCGDAPNIMSLFPEVQFYDYTAVLTRLNIPDNYHITFSLKEDNEEAAKSALRRGWNVTAVFMENEIPETFWGLPVIDGDDNDFRPADPSPCIIGLKAKGKKAKEDTTGFIQRIAA